MSLAQTLAQIQTEIEERLAAAGLSCDPGVLNLTHKSLPAVGFYFVGFVEAPDETDTDTYRAQFRADLMFSLADPRLFRTQILTGVPAVYGAFKADRSLGDLANNTTVSDGGPPELIEASIRLAVKTLFIDVELEEDA